MNYYQNPPPQQERRPDGYRIYQPPGYQPPPPQRPGPQRPQENLYQRGRKVVRNIDGLGKRARFDSMAWWGMKITQGCITSTVLMMMGFVLWVISALFSGYGWMYWAGLLALGLGGIAAVWNLAAPLTRPWIVKVPGNWYYVVIDKYGEAVEYLEPGRLVVPWRWNSKIYEYVNFNTILFRTRINNVLIITGQPVDLNIWGKMSFNPVYADGRKLNRLSEMTTPDVFQRQLEQYVQDAVRRLFSTLDPWHTRLSDLPPLEVWIEVALIEEFGSLGLTPTQSYGVVVEVDLAPDARQAYLSLPERPAKGDPEDQMLLDVKELGKRLGLHHEDAFGLYYLMQRRAPTDSAPPVAAPPAQNTQEEPPAASTRRTEEHPAVEPADLAPEDDGSEWLSNDDFNPMDARRRSKQDARRRARRAD